MEGEMGFRTFAATLTAPRRADAISLEIAGVEFFCEYTIEGSYMPANEYDPPEYPTVTLMRAEIGGVDVTHWDGEQFQITAAIEQALGDQS
jgi:hypothetical protein